VLREHGRAIVVLQLQGELDFAAAELVLADLLALRGSGTLVLLLDLDLVSRMRPVAAGLLTAGVADLAQNGVRTAAAGPTAGEVAGVHRFARPADALAWCEDALLAEVSRPR
jgi:anti-anti-sigma regulatory factor